MVWETTVRVGQGGGVAAPPVDAQWASAVQALLLGFCVVPFANRVVHEVDRFAVE